jgi:hypothetical protein
MTTDFTILPEDGEVTQMYKTAMNRIVNEIDVRLDAGAPGAGKRKFTNDLVSQYESEWQPVGDQLVNQFNRMTDEQVAANFYGLIRTLTQNFKEPIDKWLEENSGSVSVDPSEVPTDEEKKELSEERSTLAKQVKSIISLAQTFNTPGSEDWAEPKRRGASGKRGKRALSLYTWSIDGNPVDEENDSPKGVSVLLGYEKAADFTKALKEAGVNTTSPDPEFTVTLNGKEVSAQRVEDEDDDEDEVSTEPQTDEE